jgi:hypothetical protein
MFSVCVLLYGDHPDLAERCLKSIATAQANSYVQDLRIGLHSVSETTALLLKDIVARWSDRACPVILYEPVGNVFKYPTMRRMFHDSSFPLAKHVMWFDDDSYITNPQAFWPSVDEAKCDDKVLGQIWTIKPAGKQWEWITTQPWCNPKRERPDSFKFCQGAWWVAPTSIIKQLNWPIPELKHCGGDSLFGEVLAHTGYELKFYDKFVRINADQSGNNSKSKRRGYSEKNLGVDYAGTVLPVGHQEFSLNTKVLWPPETK